MTNRNINVRVLQIALIPALIVSLLLSLYFGGQRVADLEQGLDDRAAAIARQLAPAAEFGVRSGNRDVLNRLVTAVSSEQGVTSVVICDAAGTILAQVGEIDPTLAPRIARGAAIQGETDDERTLIASSPILRSGILVDDIGVSTRRTALLVREPQPVGRIYVSMSKEIITQQRHRLFLETLAITLLILTANVFIAIRMSRTVSRPMMRLTDAVQKISQGDLATRVTPDSAGLVRTLEDGVNTMAQTLESARAHLERRIADATIELEHRRQEAEHANRAKSRFLAAASHDLRQPLHALGLFVASLQGKALAPEAQQIVHQIERSIVAMQDLLESLLDISRLDTGGIAPNVIDFPLQRVFSTLESQFTPLARAKSLNLRIRATRAHVRSDPAMVERIVMNLMSNALRYTERGTVLIGCRRRGTDVCIEVWDTGIGIAPHEQKRIFDEFYRINRAEVRPQQHPGLGLGLAIVEGFARLLGHNIAVRSQPGRGSVFSIRLPRAADMTSAFGEMPDDLPRTLNDNLSGVTVLIVDDDESARNAAATLFGTWGCDVYTAASGNEAQRMLSTAAMDSPQLILCDYRLSHEETGIDALKRIGTIDGIAIPAILVSADLSADVAEAARANGYPLLNKPLRPAKLRALVQHLLLRPS
jgi:signal transduction histidine kinase/CheY-like chemotaxis protein